MAIKLSQSLKQTQSLLMTPQLQQAIKLLTLTHTEMTNVITEEMVENPILEEQRDDREKNEADYKLEKLEGQNIEASSKDFNEQNNLNAHDNFDFEKYLENYNSHSSALPPSSATRTSSDEILIMKIWSLRSHSCRAFGMAVAYGKPH